MNPQDKLIAELKENKIVREGHFLLRSGKHSNLYVSKDLICTVPKLFFGITQSFKNHISELKIYPHIITGPAIAGAIFASVVAIKEELPFVYPEKDDKGNMVFRRGFGKLLEAKTVLLIEDVITTGGSVEKTIRAINSHGGGVLDIFCIWNRSHIGGILGARIHALIDMPLPDYLPVDCPFCKDNIPLQDPKNF